MTKLAQSIHRFLSGKKIFFLSPGLSEIKCLTFWVKLDVFIVLTESFIESYVNQTCKHTVFFWNMMFCNIPQAGCCYLLFSTFSLLSRVFHCLCRKLQINVFVPAQIKMPTFGKVFFPFSCLELCEIMEKLHWIICCRWSLVKRN